MLQCYCGGFEDVQGSRGNGQWQKQLLGAVADVMMSVWIPLQMQDRSALGSSVQKCMEQKLAADSLQQESAASA
jgi:hypothetical protein